MSRFKIILLYILLGLFTLCVTIIIDFPFQILEPVISRTITQQTGLQVYLTGLKPALPAGIQATKCIIRPSQYKPLVLTSPRIKLHPLSFLSARTELDGRAGLWDGQLFFNTSIKGIKNWSAVNFNLKLKNIQLAHLKSYPGLASYIKAMHGLLSGDIDLTLPLISGGHSHQALLFQLEKMNGHGNLNIRKGSARFDLMLFQNIALNNIQADLQFVAQNGRIKIKQSDIKSDGVSGKISGSINLKRNILLSSLNMRISASVNPNAKGFPAQIKPLLQKKSFQITVQGTFASPRVAGL